MVAREADSGAVDGGSTGRVEPPDPPAAELDWGPVLAFRAALEAGEFDPGEVLDGEQLRDGSLAMPAAVLSDTASALHRTLHEQSVVAGFDWLSWVELEGQQLVDEPERLRCATLEQCRMLLAAHARADRFSEGHLLAMFADGHIAAVLHRVSELLASDPGGSGQTAG